MCLPSWRSLCSWTLPSIQLHLKQGMWAGYISKPPKFHCRIKAQLLKFEVDIPGNSGSSKSTLKVVRLAKRKAKRCSLFEATKAAYDSMRLVYGRCVYDFCNSSALLSTEPIQTLPHIFNFLDNSSYISFACQARKDKMLCGACKDGFAVTPYYTVSLSTWKMSLCVAGSVMVQSNCGADIL